MAFYCEPRYSDYGVVTCGWRGHGGLLLDGSNKIIPQYNLEAAWKRRITPISGFDEGLILPESGKAAALLRPPGHLRFDQNPMTMLNRNPICSRAVDEDSLRIWSINERSQRNALEEYRFKVEGGDGTVVDWGLKEEEGATVQRTEFSEAVSELRCSVNESFSVLCRGRQSLFAVKPDRTTATLYKGMVRSFEENPLLSDEVSVLGSEGMLWSGVIGESLARTKTDSEENLKLLVYSDHPRVLIVGSEYEVRSLDLRADVNPARIFSCPLFSEPPLPKNTATQVRPLPRPGLTHLKSLPGNPHNLIAITTDSVFLIDERCPGRHILSNKHAIPGGPSVLLPGAPVPESNGSIQSIYLLDHFCTGVWILELYQHPREIWSSVRPLHGAGDPDDRKFVPKPLEKEEPGDVFQPTRGIAVVNSFRCGGKPMDVLLRAHDDGTVSFKSYFYGQEEGVERELKDITLERNTQFAKRLKEYHEQTAEQIFGEELTEKTESNCTLIDVEVSFPAAASFSHEFHLNPLRKRISNQRVLLEPLVPAHEDAILSNVVNSYWKNVPDV